jgi:hypothetical protein
MTRLLLALVLAAGLTVAANAAVVQFSVDGVPVDGSVPIDVRPSDNIVVDIWITPDFPLETYLVDIYPTGPWVDPEPLTKVDNVDIGPAGTGEVSIPLPFSQSLSDARWLASFGVWEISGFIDGTVLIDQPGPVAFFDVHIPDVPESTLLNLEFDFVELQGPTGYDDMPEMMPLVLHVTPEPATIGLLVLGGLAALRRRFA